MAVGFAAPAASAAEQEQQRDDRQFRTADPLLAPVTVIPRKHQQQWQADEQRQGDDLPDMPWPAEGIADVAETLKESPCAGNVGDAPLRHFAFAQAAPDPRNL
jgi:hypothetical protein